MKFLKLYFHEARHLRLYMMIAVVGILASYSVYLLLGVNTVAKIGSEDQLFEWLTALCFLASFILLLITYIATRNLYLLFLAIILFFGFGEEISWGQRILGFHTPEKLTELNVQDEFNIHNLEIFNTEYKSGNTKAGVSRLLEINFLYKIFTILYGVILPLLVFHFKPASGISKMIMIPVPPVTIGIFFILNWLTFRLVLRFIFPLKYKFQYYDTATEIFEFVTAFILLVIIIYFFNIRKSFYAGTDIKQRHVSIMPD